jgi:calcium release-activated calcium channel protein 1
LPFRKLTAPPRTTRSHETSGTSAAPPPAPPSLPALHRGYPSSASVLGDYEALRDQHLSGSRLALNVAIPIGPAGGSGFQPHQLEPLNRHRGELLIAEKYRYDLSRAQLKASSRTSALLAGFAMVALVELQYEETTPKPMLILLGVVTTLLVSVHLLALMMSTCLLPYIEASGCTQDSPHIKLKFYIELSWLFSTCIGLILFLLEIGVIFFVKFNAVGYDTAGYITTAMLVPVLIIFVVFSFLIHRNRYQYSVTRAKEKAADFDKYLEEGELANQEGILSNKAAAKAPHDVHVIKNL